jgi:hypothetical protein
MLGRRSLCAERQLRTIILWLFLCGSCLAAPVSQEYLCVQGHEQEAATKLQAIIRNAVIDFLKMRHIAINSSTLQVNLNTSIQTGGDTPPYISFTGSAAGTSALTSTSSAGTVAAQDGTKFNVLLSSGSDDQDAAEYRIIRIESGFNREGNAIQPHCTLRLFNSGDIEATQRLLIVNASSGHTLGSIRLPAKISLY